MMRIEAQSNYLNFFFNIINLINFFPLIVCSIASFTFWLFSVNFSNNNKKVTCGIWSSCSQPLHANSLLSVQAIEGDKMFVHPGALPLQQHREIERHFSSLLLEFAGRLRLRGWFFYALGFASLQFCETW